MVLPPVTHLESYLSRSFCGTYLDVEESDLGTSIVNVACELASVVDVGAVQRGEIKNRYVVAVCCLGHIVLIFKHGTRRHVWVCDHRASERFCYNAAIWVAVYCSSTISRDLAR